MIEILLIFIEAIRLGGTHASLTEKASITWTE